MKKSKIKKLYYSIGEVSKQTELKQYVLRFWESEFPQLRPPKGKSGNRKYREKDIDLVNKIKFLLYTKNFTINGARKYLSKNKNAHEEIIVSKSNDEVLSSLKNIKKGIETLLDEIRNITIKDIKDL